MHWKTLILAILATGISPALRAEVEAPASAGQIPTIETRLFDLVDPARERRIPIKVYLTIGKQPKPVVLFSHGLGGSRDNNPYLGNHWAKNGYIAVFLQHLGSDRGVMEKENSRNRLTALKGAIGLQPTLDRFADVPFVIDQLEQWNAEETHPLHGKLDLQHIGLAGHSYGAVTTLGLTDRTFTGNRTFHEKRIDAFLPMSPQPGMGGSPERHFGRVTVPVLCLTGTDDRNPVDPTLSPADRRKVYAAFPAGDKYQLVFEGAHHFTFSDSGSALKRRGRTPHHHAAIQQISTKFWDAYLKGDEAAKQWLQSEKPRTDCPLDEKDVWEWK